MVLEIKLISNFSIKAIRVQKIIKILQQIVVSIKERLQIQCVL